MKIIKQTHKEQSPKWVEECKNDMVKIIQHSTTTLKTDNATWYKWSKDISIDNKVISDNDLLNGEVSNNIDFRKVMKKEN